MAKKWSDMSPAEKLAQLPEYKKSIEKKITDLKKELSRQKSLLKTLDNEEKAIKFDLISEKAKEKNQNIEDLMK